MVDDLVDYEHNTRTHSAEQVAQIAASINEFGFTNPLLIDAKNGIIAGHGRAKAARGAGLVEVPCIVLDHLSEQQQRALVIADNQLALNAGWDDDLLASELQALSDGGFDMGLVGFDAAALAGYLATDDGPLIGLTDEDDVPAVAAEVVSAPGDVWVMGGHRVMCGDSTAADDVARLTAGAVAELVHADPPYGMGKQKDGVANDNLYREKLDRFLMQWWAAFLPYLAANAAAYLWGTAPDLWRLWYCGGLNDSESFKLCNEIVWDKKNTQGMGGEGFRSYPIASERALYFMRGAQQYNTNQDNYWPGWDPIRLYLAGEKEKIQWTDKTVAGFFGFHSRMAAHWFSKSQWSMITAEQYARLQSEANGAAFLKPYNSLRAEFDSLRAEFDSLRAFFDNTHDTMTDVWEFPRVVGAERHGHATPKPVAMMARIMKSSCPPGGLCLEPFGGSGSTLIGAENTGRRCYTMELQPKYVDVIVRRWQAYTGGQAVRESDGLTFDEVAAGAR